MALGVEVTTRTAPPARGAPTDIDTAFLLIKSGSGSLTGPVEVRSLSDFVAEYGVRTTGATANAVAYDWLDAFFREGGQKAVVQRYGSSPTTTLAAGIALLSADLGGGQIAAPYETPGSGTFTALHDAAIATDRFALYDAAVGDDTAAELTTIAGGLPANDEYGMFAGQWASIPAPAGVIGGSARQVQGSAITAALIARADALGNPNRAAAGRDFPIQYATGFVYLPTDDDRETLLNAGINTFADKYGVLQLYGFQTKLAANDDNPFWQANAARARMWLVHQAKQVGENYMFRPLDGQGKLQRSLKTDLDAVCLRLYGVDGLYGETPQEAFAVTTGASVNTEGTVAQGELHGVVEARFSLHVKSVQIELVSVPITGRVSQP
jgi:hypothetical protein